MPAYALLFEAESIQTYLFDTGRLRDAVGASHLVDGLCRASGTSDLLSRVVGACAFKDEDVRFSRRAGGAFIALFDDPIKRQRLRSLWSLAVASHAPGLRWSDAVAEGQDCLRAAKAGMQVLRSGRAFQPPELPECGPMVHRSPRTGRAAVELATIGGESEPVDAETACKRRAAQDEGALCRRFSSDNSLLWPRDLEPGGNSLESFPFIGGRAEVAFVHADGTGLDATLRIVEQSCQNQADAYVNRYARFSEAVSNATAAAAEMATAKILVPNKDMSCRMPARPLVLGGDDLTVIVRADLAIPFAEAFLEAFETASKAELAQFSNIPDLPPYLSATAGIAIVKSTYPFAQASEMAEKLCSAAKLVVKAGGGNRPLSAVHFHRLTSALPDSDDDLFAGDTLPGSGNLRLAAGPYMVCDPTKETKLPRLGDLKKLSNILADDDASRGPVRQLMSVLYQGEELARVGWANWRRATARRNEELLNQLDECLARLGVPAGADLPFGGPDSKGHRHTPLADALLLRNLAAPAKGDDDPEDVQ